MTILMNVLIFLCNLIVLTLNISTLYFSNVVSKNIISHFLLSFKNSVMQIIPKYDSFWAFLLIASLIPVFAILLSRFVAPNNSTPEKSTTYESGIEPMGESWIQFEIRYYMFALVFVVFDVETVFLYPWAMVFNQFGIMAFVEVLVFILILIIGLLYAWRKGALEWS